MPLPHAASPEARKKLALAVGGVNGTNEPGSLYEYLSAKLIRATRDSQYEPARDHHGQVFIILSERTQAVNSDIFCHDPFLRLFVLVKAKWGHCRATDFQHVYPKEGLIFVTVHPYIEDDINKKFL